MKLQINGAERDLPEAWADESLLTALREPLGLVGTKFGCGDGECGTCVVHIDGQALRSCTIRARDAAGRRITTIEGLASADSRLHPIQQAWLDERVAQCGYCQAGQIMQAAALLASNPDPDDEAIAAHLSGNLCRCGTYVGIRKAVLAASKTVKGGARG